MNTNAVRRMRLYAAMVGVGALIALGGTAVQHAAAQMSAAGASTIATNVPSTPPTAPATEKAVPRITGPAPLYAGEDPDTNPQAPIP